MVTFLAYVEPVPGRLHPLVATLRELVRRGHRVSVRCGVDQVDLLSTVGIEAAPLAPELVEFEPQDRQARTRFGALTKALNEFGERAGPQVPDLHDIQQALAVAGGTTAASDALEKLVA